MEFLPALNADERQSILQKWLFDEQRALTPPQREAVLSAFARNPSPLWLRLVFEQARCWRAGDQLEFELGGTPAEVVSAFFDRLEREHGTLMVSRVAEYLSLTRFGIAEAPDGSSSDSPK